MARKLASVSFTAEQVKELLQIDEGFHVDSMAFNPENRLLKVYLSVEDESKISRMRAHHVKPGHTVPSTSVPSNGFVETFKVLGDSFKEKKRQTF